MSLRAPKYSQGWGCLSFFHHHPLEVPLGCSQGFSILNAEISGPGMPRPLGAPLLPGLRRGKSSASQRGLCPHSPFQAPPGPPEHRQPGGSSCRERPAISPKSGQFNAAAWPPAPIVSRRCSLQLSPGSHSIQLVFPVHVLHSTSANVLVCEEICLSSK